MNQFFSVCAGVLCAGVLQLAPIACFADEVFPVVHPEPILVRVLDGKTGRPQAHAHVLLKAGYDRHDLALGMWKEEIVTGANGNAKLSDAMRNLPLMRVEVRKLHVCSPAAEAPWSVERIRLTGLSGVNRCGDFSVVDEHGVLTVFVKGGKLNPEPGPKPVAALVDRTPVTSKAAVPGAPLTEAEMDQMLANREGFLNYGELF